MNVLILEGHGAIGRCLARRFIKEGHSAHILGEICDDEYCVHNIKIEDNKFKDILKEENFDIIIDVSKILNNKKAFDINVKNIEKLLKLSKEYNVKKVILLSTTDVYMDGNEVDEKSRIVPRTAYGISMLAYEEYYNIYKDIFETDLGILRVSNIYGSNLNNTDEYIKNIVQAFLNSDDLNDELLENCKDYICVKDVVNGVYKSVFKEGSFIYNLSYGRSYTGSEIIEILKLIEFEHKYSRESKDERFSISNKLAEEELGWYPKINLEEGIYFLVNSLKNKEFNGKKKSRNFIAFLIINLIVFLGIYIFSMMIDIEYEIHILNLIMFLLVLISSILGLKEGIVTGGLSSIVLIFNALAEFRTNGRISTICLEGVIVNVLIYMLTSLLIGSIIDKNKKEFNRVEKKYNILYDKLKFICRLYKDE